MANNVKYKDQTLSSGEQLSANGVYTGHQIGTPLQGDSEAAANADAYHVPHSTVRQGTIAQDAQDNKFPEKCFSISYDLNGGTGAAPAPQTQAFSGDGKLTIAGFPATGATPPKYFEKDESSLSTSLKVVADNATPGEGEIRVKDVLPRKTSYTPAANDYVKLTAYTFSKWNTAADAAGTDYAVNATPKPTADIKLFAVYTE